MTDNGLFQITLFLVVLVACVKPLGAYMARVYQGESRWLGWLERPFYALSGIDAKREMGWREYTANVLAFSAGGFVLLYCLLRWQSHLPFNPMGMGDLTPHLAFNTAASFVANTNWQSYGGESTMSYFSQFAGLAVQNFLSAATGMAVLVAFIRGLARKNSKAIGNFWVDLLRSNLYILLPLSIIVTLLLQGQGVVQTMEGSIEVPLLESVADADGNSVVKQTLAVGPVASQEAIKMLGTNGGGFFNANSAHPFENPTPFSNFIEMLAILVIPGALCYTFGTMVGDRRQGWAVLTAMTIIFVPFVLFGVAKEQSGNPHFTTLGIEEPAPNMEGKETRFGITNSALFAAVTTAASCGAVNSMHDSFTPLGGLVPLVLMQFGEVIYGGVGSGLYGMLIFVIITVFLAGLMVGRTPEYLGKKIGAFEMKMASFAILVMPVTVLFGTALAVLTEVGRAGIFNPGAQGFSEILYAVTSGANNNGSAFAGLSANTPFWNTLLGIAMLVGRFWIIVPVLAIAGSMAAKTPVPHSVGTLSTHTLLFILFLVGTVLLVGVLTFVPALAVGPVVEHLTLHAGN